MHFPSFLVGSFTTGGVFLLVHQQTSYRSRLSYKWPLAETAEKKVRQYIAEMRSGGGDNSSKSLVAEASSNTMMTTPKQLWNQGISNVQDAIRSLSSPSSKK